MSQTDMQKLQFQGTVISWYPYDIENIHKPGLMPEFFTIKAGDPAKKVPSFNSFDSLKRKQYMNEDQGWAEMLVPASELCESIVQDYFKSCIETAGDVGPGIFWVPGIITPALLTADKNLKSKADYHYDMQRRWFEKLVAKADDTWQHVKQYRAITTIQKYAAEFLNLEREWLFVQQTSKQNVRCEACGSVVPETAVKCANCGFILNVDKYNKLKDRF